MKSRIAKLIFYIKWGFSIGSVSALILTMIFNAIDRLFLGVSAMIFGVILCGFEGRGGIFNDCGYWMIDFSFVLAFIFYVLLGGLIGIFFGVLIRCSKIIFGLLVKHK